MPVYALSTCVTANDGGRIRITEGEAFDEDHPAVKSHPHLFGDKPPKVRGATVETATAEPGQKRSTRRRADAD